MPGSIRDQIALSIEDVFQVFTQVNVLPDNIDFDGLITWFILCSGTMVQSSAHPTFHWQGRLVNSIISLIEKTLKKHGPIELLRKLAVTIGFINEWMEEFYVSGDVFSMEIEIQSSTALNGGLIAMVKRYTEDWYSLTGQAASPYVDVTLDKCRNFMTGID